MNGKNLTIGIFVAISLLTSGMYVMTDKDKTYYCASSGLVGMCDKLSSGIGTRCYYNETYKTCPEGWQKIEKFIQSNNYKQYLCNQEKCTQIG